MSQVQFYLLQLYSYSIDCGFKPIGSAGCNPFWGFAFSIAILLCAIVFVQAAHHIYKERVAFRKYQNKLIERAKIADDETMNSVKWNSDHEFNNLSHDEIAEKFREQLNQK